MDTIKTEDTVLQKMRSERKNQIDRYFYDVKFYLPYAKQRISILK